jgi:cyclophilin family peptidyl-prolyl cis-trans isomerase
VSTAKRQRQKAGRQARKAAEEKAAKRRRLMRRGITLVIVAAVVVGISVALTSGSSNSKKHASAKKASTTTTTTRPPTAGGSGNTSPAAETTSADCPASFTATLNKPSYSSFPPMTIDPSKTYTADVTTNIGSFTIQLLPKEAPKAVDSFVFLAEHHFFDCVTFHRVIKGFVDQTGDPTGTGEGGPGYHFTEHGPPTASPQYPLGSVAMANSNAQGDTDPNTNGSQFFIVAGPAGETLPPDYVLFGKVTSGMNVVETINAGGAPATSSAGTPTKLYRMVSVKITVS